MNSHFFPKNYRLTNFSRSENRKNTCQNTVSKEKINNFFRTIKTVKTLRQKDDETQRKRTKSHTHYLMNNLKDVGHFESLSKRPTLKNQPDVKKRVLLRKRERTLVVKGTQKQLSFELNDEKLSNSKQMANMNHRRLFHNHERVRRGNYMGGKTVDLRLSKKCSKQVPVRGWQFNLEDSTLSFF